MSYAQICPQLKIHNSHAKFLKRSLNIKLGEALDMVAHIHGYNDWKKLKAKNRQQINSTNTIPMSDVGSLEISSFWRLIDKYEKELSDVYNQAIHLSSNILTLILNRKINTVEHSQITGILAEFDEEHGTSKDLINIICCIDNTAYKIVKSQKKNWQVDTGFYEIRNLWLNSETFQQDFYAYYHFDNKRVHIKVREWDTRIRIPSTKSSIVNKTWFVEMMIGYIKMIAKQLITLGYQPTFTFFKIQNIYLHKLTSDYKNANHVKHGIYKLTQRLIELGGFENDGIKYDKIGEERGVRVSFNKDSFR